ncbi:MAG: glycerophosphodiester phosphodiesterase [Rhodospirillaceae bacterium]|nr:glycerophosphodiester phosphodiesterase [Rhodospirillaceae bacterium]
MPPDLPQVIGHRGAAAEAPENTLEGFREAARQGARAVEFDAKLTADGVVILMHDETLERTTNGRGAVAETPAAAIARLDAGAWFGPDWAGARVPTLEEALHLLARLDLYPNIEIKPCPGREAETARAVVETVRCAWPPGRPAPLLSSFAEESLRAAGALAPDLPRGLLVEGVPEDWRAKAESLGCVSLHCAQEDMSPVWAAAVRQAGLRLAVYTVNDVETARRLVGWGVQALFSDRPGLIQAAL